MAETWPRTRRGKKKRNNPCTKYDALATRRVLRDTQQNEYRASIFPEEGWT